MRTSGRRATADQRRLSSARRRQNAITFSRLSHPAERRPVSASVLSGPGCSRSRTVDTPKPKVSTRFFNSHRQGDGELQFTFVCTLRPRELRSLMRGRISTRSYDRTVCLSGSIRRRSSSLASKINRQNVAYAIYETYNRT